MPEFVIYTRVLFCVATMPSMTVARSVLMARPLKQRQRMALSPGTIASTRREARPAQTVLPPSLPGLADWLTGKQIRKNDERKTDKRALEILSFVLQV